MMVTVLAVVFAAMLIALMYCVRYWIFGGD